MSGWRRGREASRLANIHGGSSEWDFWGLEHVDVLQAFGCGVRLMLESGVLGGPWVGVIERNPPVCQLEANMADKYE